MANIYDMIANPTQGKLGDIGTSLLQIKQMQLNEQQRQRENQLANLQQALPMAQVAGSYSQAVLDGWEKAQKADTPPTWDEYKRSVYSTVPEELRSFIPNPDEDALSVEGMAGVRDKAKQTINWFSSKTKTNPKPIDFPLGTDDKGVPQWERRLYQDGELTERSQPFTKLQVTAETELDPDKRDARVTTRNVVQLGEDIKRFVNSPDFMGGATGDFVSMVNSLTGQFQQATGIAEPLITENGVINDDVLNISEANASRLERAAIKNDRTDAAIFQLAYVLAKLRDPGGRLSDFDVQQAEKTLARGGDRKSILRTINDTQMRSLREYNNMAKESGWEPLYMKDIIQPSTPTYQDTGSPGSAADRILQDMGL